ncbi:carbohydrate esterase family 16 protein [Fomitiporia mediterranea MF3/22]|uniref:carbohydrate esterase family 16 protein n=1 Tax=Fomitiporia mediterranea (strain MF3/22) TaxID=694068 RepID=UPI00044094F1|nr:carbohydrate esterase family 16 protein [Fomitiporia mediterranea MF3/22]EJD06123.1 carbohydrate esterase family 16 protein [Fomitiporia mediterranea MF3/22]
MFKASFALLSLLSCLTAAFAAGPPTSKIKNIVTFGDSYTQVEQATGDGGQAWPVYVADYANLTLFPFARAGAVCSNNLTFKPFPSIFESQLPLFFTELENGTLHLNQEETVYTLWIGTNDVGVGALLTGDQTKGVTLVDTVGCAVNWVKALFEKGARNFIFQNMIPLQDTILYSANSYPNHYWLLPRNTTEWSVFMTELTTSGNEIAQLMLQNVAKELPEAHIGLFDSHGLFTDIFTNPSKYLNGTVPVNVTGAVSQCIFPEGGNGTPTCTFVNGPARDSFMWFDELHPSEQSDRTVARNIANAILRIPTQWISWF